MKIIELENICFEYEEKVPVLEDLSLAVEKGSCVLITGDNGSGKTTLFRILNGLSFPGSGLYFYKNILIDKDFFKDSGKTKRFHKEIGYLFQNPDTMLFNSSVYDEIAFGPRQMGLSDKEVDERVKNCLKLLDIEALSDKVPYHLSGGQKKMVALASVLALNPEVLVLDEPFAGLDKSRQEKLAGLLTELKAAGKTLIIATHDPEELQGIADESFRL